MRSIMRTTTLVAIRGAILGAALGVTACAGVVEGGPPMPLAPALMETARVDAIYMSSGVIWWAGDDFSDTFTEEVREELSRCATGTYPLNLRLHVDDMRKASRAEVLAYGDGMHSLAAVAEFVDPARGNMVVGRFPIVVGTQAGGRVAGLLGDREMMVSEEYGRALCDEAFGRNPRAPGPHNATRG